MQITVFFVVFGLQPSFGTGIHSDFICCMAKRNGRFIIFLNVTKVLFADEMAGLSTSTDVKVALEPG